MKKSWPSGFTLRNHLFDARLKLKIVAAMTIFALVPFFAAMAQEKGQGEDAFVLEEIIVSSSRISQKGFEAPTPTTVMTGESLKNQGLINIADLINQAPVFRSSYNETQGAGGFRGGGGQNYVNMRGLGPKRTLVLMNGNRIVPTTNEGTTDLNLIPSIAIERTDVVTGGASAAWGSDAVAGVVNLITKRGYEGLELEIRGGQTMEGDDETGSFSALYGKKLNDTMSLLIAAELEHRAGGVTTASRDWSDKMGGHFVGPNGIMILANDIQFGGLMTPGGHLLGPPPLGGQNISLDGQSVAPAVNPGMYRSGAQQSGGDYHLSHPQGTMWLSTPFDRQTALVSLHTKFSDTLRGVFELNYGHSESDYPSVPYANVVKLFPDNPYLPQQIVDYIGRRPYQDVGIIESEKGGLPLYHADQENETYRVNATIDGDLAKDWTWNAHYSYGQNESYAGYYNVLNYSKADQSLFPSSQSPFSLALDAVRDPGGNIVCRSGAPGCVPLNILGVGLYDPAVIDYVYGWSWQEVKTKQHNFAVNVQGNIGSTPAGPISVAAGYEYRVDEIGGTSDEKSKNNLWDQGNPQPIDGDMDVNEGYMEVLVPLLADKPFAEALDLNAAVRYAEYELAGGATTWKAGATYKINSEFRLRASKSRDIRAPNLLEVFLGSQLGSTANVRDYSGYPNPALVYRETSGNPELKPEESDTVSYGFSYQPNYAPGLSIGADYYDIEITDAISTISAEDLAQGCAAGNQFYCSKIDFWPGDPTGKTIELIHQQPINVDTVVTRGVDIELAYEFSALDGEFALRALGSYVAEISDSGSGGFDRAGQIGDGVLSRTSYWAPEWVWDANVRYTRRAFGVNLHSRYIDSGVLDATAASGGKNAGKLFEDFNGDGVLAPIISVPSRVYFDLAADYTFELSNGSAIQVFAGGRNIFNTEPPQQLVILRFGSLGSLYDIYGTTYYGGVRVKF